MCKLESMVLHVVILWLKKLRRKNHGHVKGKRDWTCLGEIMLLAMDAVRKNGPGNNPETVWELSRTYEEHEEEKKVYN